MAYKIGRAFGIDVSVHFTFPLFVAWIVLSEFLHPLGTINTALYYLIFILAIFATVVMHEFGHALMARKFGVKTRHITLYPMGGVASMEKIPEKPLQEFLVAFAGPSVNILIALILYVGLILSGLTYRSNNFFAQFMLANVSLAVFNLLPAFPLDGGRVFRAFLSTRVSRLQATKIAATVGKGFALLFVFLGLKHNLMLVIVAVFIWISSSAELEAVKRGDSSPIL